MKVLDLQCPTGHRFEGWFSSEDDFAQQLTGGLLECPFCASKEIRKCLSAPRLNLKSGSQSTPAADARLEQAETGGAVAHAVNAGAPQDAQLAASMQQLQRAWMEVAKHVVKNTTDVGDRFAEEARKMHYGEKPVAAIRGQASVQEVHELWDEGVEVMPLPIPDALKNGLQ